MGWRRSFNGLGWCMGVSCRQSVYCSVCFFGFVALSVSLVLHVLSISSNVEVVIACA